MWQRKCDIAFESDNLRLQVADLTGHLDAAEDSISELRAQLDARGAAVKDAEETQQNQAAELAAARSAKDELYAEVSPGLCSSGQFCGSHKSTTDVDGAKQAH
jgi:chromosome segregation ATPase